VALGQGSAPLIAQRSRGDGRKAAFDQLSAIRTIGREEIGASYTERRNASGESRPLAQQACPRQAGREAAEPGTGNAAVPP